MNTKILTGLLLTCLLSNLALATPTNSMAGGLPESFSWKAGNTPAPYLSMLPQQAPTLTANPSMVEVGGSSYLKAAGAYHYWIFSTDSTTMRNSGPVGDTVNINNLTKTTTYWVKGVTDVGGGNFAYSDKVYVTITVRSDVDLIIPNIITPNGDGVNDYFAIQDLNTYMENELTIYTRWMTMVYNKKNYDNKWMGEGLNEGVYYYLLKMKKSTGEDKYFKGFVQILR